MSSSAPLRFAPLCLSRRRWRRPRRQRGQTLIIFALTFSTLLGLSGLAVDVARAYDLYGKLQRAAEAGALAAALYMPNNFDTTLQSGSGPAYSAITRLRRGLQRRLWHGRATKQCGLRLQLP
jgi:hypothetical protein